MGDSSKCANQGSFPAVFVGGEKKSISFWKNVMKKKKNVMEESNENTPTHYIKTEDSRWQFLTKKLSA